MLDESGMICGTGVKGTDPNGSGTRLLGPDLSSVPDPIDPVCKAYTRSEDLARFNVIRGRAELHTFLYIDARAG